ncbi:ribbon-helix-helix domain-containing protein [Brucella gallinifaecis]|uniref:Aryl-sulfate sulfotransferase n=1 Tax=Brucella gallinifaecis TaxID=215590 RepID=A0A502BSM8_9HYPH|nr:ribbon-helix-helix domain-containing protein [Brucella gallinifaecis]TPF76651.1 aryl-sulfate sulfotransferase [Brucella gallinifaecis]
MSGLSRLKKRSVNIRGHATSYTLEDPFFEQLEEIAKTRQISVAYLVTEIDEQRDRSVNLSSALRLHILDWLKSRIPPQG